MSRAGRKRLRDYRAKRDTGRFVPFPPIGDGGEVRTVGFKDYPLQRNLLHCFLQDLVFVERHWPADPQIESEGEELLCQRAIAEERVDDPVVRGAVMPQDREEVLRRLAIVDDDRELRLSSKLDLCLESTALYRSWGEIAVVVEADLPDRDDLWRLCQRLQAGEDASVKCFRVVGMDSYRGPDRVVPLRE
jgi:hypothetical protein